MGDEGITAARAKDDTEALPPVPSREPVQIGPYRILGVIGRGGMGTIYRAEPVVSCPVPMGRVVALKVLRRLADRGERLRFAREASYLQALRHRGIVRVLDVGENHGQPYLVMQLVDGKALDELIGKAKRLEEDRVVDLIIQALEALHVAHLAGILHRDIKPSNIMVTLDGTVKLLDFGLAQRMDGSSKLTATGTVIGTPAYMSPEQAAGERNDLSRRSDIYSVGACLYEMLTGVQPFIADNSVALLRRIIEEPLESPRELRTDLSRDLETVILKAMAKDARDRYPSAEAMAEDLRRFARGLRVRARRPSQLVANLRQLWSQRRALAGAGLVLFVAAATLGLTLRQAWRNNERLRAEAVLAKDSQLIDSAWVVEWRGTGLVESSPDVPLAAHQQGTREARLATLPPVVGPVRVAFDLEPKQARWTVELMVSDRDVGRGYRIVIDAAEDGARFDLLREDKVVASRPLGRIPRGARLPVRFERVDETLSAVVGETAVSFLDLTPIEGADADGTYLVFLPGEVAIKDVVVERRRGGLYVNALATADLHRQDGRYRRAIREYEKFLRDYPKRPEARDARYRIALCQEQLGEDETALAAFLAIVRDYRDEPRYVLAATFRAWSCALRLGRYDDAELYLEAIRRESSLDSLLSSVPQETLTQLAHDYHLRAMRVADADPRRALRLYDTCGELADRLGMHDDFARATYGAGDMLIALDDIDGALERFARVAGDLRCDRHLRTIATLKSAEGWRLKDRFDRARAAYQLAVESADNGEDLSQWARLWLGDLFIEMGEPTQAQECWRQSFESDSLPGRLMTHLLHSSQPIAVQDGGWYGNDVAWFAARQAFVQHRDRDYIGALASIASGGPAHDWPTALAKHALRSLPSEESDDAEAPREPAPMAPRQPPPVLRSPLR